MSVIESFPNIPYPSGLTADPTVQRYLAMLHESLMDFMTYRPEEIETTIGSNFAFKTITGITDDVVADQKADTLTLASTAFMTIVGTAASDTVTYTVQVKDEDDMVSDSAVHLATQQSIKAYADAIKSDSDRETITQVGHGFAAKNVIKGLADGTYEKAKADSAANAEVLGIVESVDGNDFVVVWQGRLSDVTGLTANTLYLLSPTTAGLLTTTEPSTEGQVSKPVLYATSTTTGLVVVYRGMIVGHDSPTNEPTGFPNRTDSVLSWGGTRTFTITPTGSSFIIYENDVVSTISGAENVQIDDTSGIHAIYYDEGTLTALVNPSEAQYDTLMETKPLVGLVYWNATDGSAYILADERHGVQMDGATHHYLHDNIGAVYKSGGTVSGYTLATATDVAVSFDITDTEIYDEDVEIEAEDGVAANQYEQVLTGDAEIPVLYKDDVDGTWKEQAASTLPYIVQGGDTYPSYNNDDGDSTWSLIELGNQKFMLNFLIMTNDWQYPVKMVCGSETYNTMAGALNAIGTEVVNWGTMPSAEFVLLYVFVVQAAPGGTKNVKITEVQDFRLSEVSGASYSPTDHGVLSGLSDNDHGAVYYTETEVDTRAFELDGNDDWQPVLTDFNDPFWEKDANDDIMPRAIRFNYDSNGDVMPV